MFPLVRCGHPPNLSKKNKKKSKNISDQFSRHFRHFRSTLVFSILWQFFFFKHKLKKNVGQKFQKLFSTLVFSILWPSFFLTQQVKIVQSPVSSRQLKHLRQSSRRSSGNNFQLVVAVRALDQWEASIYHSRIVSTNERFVVGGVVWVRSDNCV